MNAVAMPLMVVTFGLPVLAWGAVAAALPILIHLVLRQRPRKQILPTLRFLLQAQKSSTRMHRLKRFVLLACRMAVLVLVVGLLMKTGCAPPGSASTPGNAPLNGPISAVIAIDDSASMQYRYQGRTRLDDALTWAQNLITDPERFPTGSEFAVVAGSTSTAPVLNWTKDVGAATRSLHEVTPGWHDGSMAALLRHACGLIPTGSQPRRELYLFTDLTESAWGDATANLPKELAGVFILDVGRNENRNVALGLPEVPLNTLPVNQSSSCRIRVRSGDEALTCTVTLSIDGQPRDRQSMAMTEAHTETALSFALPPLSEGPHALVFELDPDDAMSFDNRRFASVATGSVPAVMIVGDDARESVASMVAAMIAPPAQPASEHRYTVQRITGSSLTTGWTDQPLALILADPSGITPGGWQAVSRFISGGGSMILLPGPNTTAAAYAGQDELLPAEVRGVVTLATPINLAAANLNLPYLKPFVDPGIDSINDRPVYRRLELGPLHPGSSVVVPFSDRSPAIVERTVGRGRAVLLGFSPDRDWSQFGTQAAPLIVLLHSMLETLSPRPSNTDAFIAGRSPTHTWPDSPGIDLHIQSPDGNATTLDVVGDTSALPNRQVGHYRVVSNIHGKPPLLLYDVNVAEAESELGRIEDDKIVSRFPAGTAWIAHPPDSLPARQAGARGAVGWSVPLALILAGLLWFETLFANRFYGRRQPASAVKVQS